MTVSLEEGEKEEEISKYPSAAAPTRLDKIRSDSIFLQTTKKKNRRQLSPAAL